MDALINEYFSSGPEQRQLAARNLAEPVKSTGILGLVRALHTQLTGPDEQTRADATECLADVLSILGVASEHRKILWTFFCDRLTDGESFIAALRGLETIGSGDMQELKAAITDSNFRKRTQNSRYAAYRFLRTQLSRPEAADLFIELASGEKDPKNLLLTLDIAATLLNTLDFDAEKREDLFDLTFCYFPITFKPSKDMPYTVNVEDIKSRLRSVLSSPQISSFVVPSLISKLNAVNPEIKADVLLTLKTVLSSYPDSLLSEFMLPVWDSLKFEIIHGSPENPSNAAIFEILQLFLSLEEFIKLVATETGKIDPTKRALAIQTCILATGIANSPETLAQTATPILEVLFIDQQVGNIEYINTLYASRLPLPQEYNDKILSLMLSGLASQDFYALAAAGITPLVLHVPDFAPVVVQALSHHIPDPKAISAISVVARIAPQVVLSECISKLFAKVEDTFTNESKQALQIIGSLSVTKEILNSVTIRLCARAQQLNEDARYLFEILTTILTGLQSLDTPDLARYYTFISPILPLFFNAAPKQAFSSETSIYRMCLIMEITVRAIPKAQQADYAEGVCKLIWPGNTSVFGRSPSPLSYLMTGCLIGIDEENLPACFQITFVEYLDILKRTHNVFQRAGYLRYLAVAVNKWPKRFGDIALALKYLRTSIETDQDAVSNLEVFSWLSKGLLLRNDKLGFEGVDFITNIIINPNSLAQYAARVFGVLVADDRILSKENGLLVRPLYKQRLFLQSLPRLMEGFNKQETKLNSTTAISTLMRFTPLKVLQEHFDSVVPVVIECLDPSLDASLQNGALVTIASTIAQPGAIFLYEKNLDRIINSCLALVAQSADPMTRSKAIEVLYLAAKHLPLSSTKPFAELVLTKLPQALSDSRRDVRKQASRTIQIYHVL